MSSASDTPSANQANQITLSNVRLVVSAKRGWLRDPRRDWRNRAIQPTRVIRVAEVATIPEPACLYRWINSVIECLVLLSKAMRQHQASAPERYLAIRHSRVGQSMGQYHLCGSRLNSKEPLSLVRKLILRSAEVVRQIE